MEGVIEDPIAWAFWGWGGAALALTLANIGSAYGTAKSGMGIASMAVTRPHLAFKSIGPAARALCAGLVCGLSQLAAGYAIGIVGEHGVKCFAMNEQIFVALILILIFAEVLGLYGMIVAIILQLG